MANIFESAFMTLKNGMTMYFADSKARQWLQKLQEALAKKYGPDNPPPATEGGRIWYATCSTASGTGAKTATTSTGDFVLATGSMARVLFTTSNTAANPTISIDGSTAKTIQPKSGTSGMANLIAAGEVVDLVYDGTNFIMTKGGSATTTFYGITKLNSSTSSTSTTEAATPSAVKDAYDLAASKASVPVAIADGGTGATTAAAALTSLGAVAKAGDTMTGDLTFHHNKAIVQTMQDTSNWRNAIVWMNTTPSSFTYKPHIGFWNTGGNSSYPGVIDLIPFGTNASPWGRADGLSISHDDIRFNGATVRTGTVAVADGGTGAVSAAAANANLHNYNLLEGLLIANNTDLNTIVTPNIYRTATDSITASLINKPPVTQPFQLAVMYINSDYAVMQHVNEWLSGNEWRRFGYISGGSWTWGAWHKISELFPLSVGSGGTGATNGADALANLGVTEAFSSGNGSLKLPNGTLIQWGVATPAVASALTQIGTSGIYYGTTSLTFPIAFANANYYLSGVVRYSTGHIVPIGFYPTSSTTAYIGIYDFYARPASSTAYNLRWFAIGRWA